MVNLNKSRISTTNLDIFKSTKIILIHLCRVDVVDENQMNSIKIFQADKLTWLDKHLFTVE